MFHKTEGILIRKTKLASGGLIVKFYTRHFGIKSYFGRVSKKEKNTYLPLTIATITAYENSKKSINSIKEYQVETPLRNIYQDIYKSNILIFINEVLNYVIQEEEANEKKFTFLKEQILHLEEHEFDVNFHLIFLMRLTYLIGIEPNLDSTGVYYDFVEGELTNEVPTHPNFFDENETKLFNTLYQHSFDNSSNLTLSNAHRKKALLLIITYYRYHTDMRELKSLPVLEAIFN